MLWRTVMPFVKT